MTIYMYGFQAGKDTFTVSALRGLPTTGGPSVGVPVTRIREMKNNLQGRLVTPIPMTYSLMGHPKP